MNTNKHEFLSANRANFHELELVELNLRQFAKFVDSLFVHLCSFVSIRG